MDARSKEPREFLCRVDLWEAFSRAADDCGCSVGYLINEAMRRYLGDVIEPAAQRPPCPRCASPRVARIVYGLGPGDEPMQRAIADGQVILGGCVPDGNLWRCNDCDERWG